MIHSDSRASGNEDSGSDSDGDSEVGMTDAEDLDLEEAVFDKNPFEEATLLYQRHLCA